MARRGWVGSIATAIGVAAGAGAAQLGFGYGLGIINWAPTGAGAGEAAWVASLAWATWISATSTIAGAVCAQRLHHRGLDGDAGPAAVGGDEVAAGSRLRRVTLAVAGAVGALITVLLVAVPARAATVVDTFSPQSIAAGYAGIGLLVGVLVALWALHSRAAAGNVIATVGWLWLLAVISVVDGVLSGRGLGTAQLGIWQISEDSTRFWIRDYFYWPGAVLSMGSALLIGALAARRTARLAKRRVGAAASGAAGPLLVAVAYLLAVPRLSTIGAEQVSAHLIAPYAVIVGTAGSVLVAALAQRAERRAAARGTVTVPRQRTGDLDALPAGTPAGRTFDADPTTEPVGSAGPESVTVPAPGTGSEPAVAAGRARPDAGRKPRATAATTTPGPRVPGSDAAQSVTDRSIGGGPRTEGPATDGPEEEPSAPTGPKARTNRRSR